MEFSDGANLLGAISDAGTVGNLFASGGISTFDNTVADGYGEFTGLCLGNGANCITSWGSAGAIDGSGLAGYAVYWEDANTLNGERYLATSRGGTGINTASSTGVATVSGGTWSIASALLLSYGGTGASLSDPNADRIMFWDDSAGAVTWLTAGSNLTISDTTLNASGGSGDITSVGDVVTGDAFTADGTGNSLYFEGTATDDIETILTVADPTGSDKTITLPNITGTVALTSDLHDAVTIGTANGLSLSTQVLSLVAADTTTTGALTSADWNTFNGKQAGDAALTNISGLAYVSDSFIKLTANDTYAVRTIAETKTDLSLDSVENTALSSWAGTTNITTLGTIGTGVWNGTIIDVTHGGTGLDGSSAANGTLLIGNGTGYTLATLTEGEGIDITNASESITILGEDASTTNKGIASFNPTNFSVSSGAVNTIQDIAAASSPTFTGLTLSGITQGSIIFAGASGALSQDNDNFFWDNSNNRLGIGTKAPSSDLEIYSGTANPFLTITGAHDTNCDPMIKFRTGVSPTVKFSMGVDADDSDKFKIYSGDEIGGTSEFTIDTSGTTSISNLELGAQYFETNAGAVGWIDMPVTSASNGTVESYTARLDSNSMITVYGISDGAGSVSNLGVGIGDTSPLALLTVGDGDLFQVNSNGAIVAATGITSSGTITFSGFSTGIVHSNASGVLSSSAVDIASADDVTGILPIANGGTNSGTALSNDRVMVSSGGAIIGSTTITTTELGYLDGVTGALYSVGGTDVAVADGGTGASTQFTPGSIVFAGASGVYSQDNDNFFWDDSSYELGIGTATPSAMLDIYGTSNTLQLSYDGSNYSTLATNGNGELVLSTTVVGESSIIIGDGSAENTAVIFDGNVQDYYAGLDDTDDAFKIGLGSAVGTTPYLTILSGGNVGIGTTDPGALLDVYKTGTLASDDIVNKISVDDAAASDEYFLTMVSDADGTTPDTEFKFTTDGTAHADGTWEAGGADYAEYFWTEDDNLEAGEAVCVDTSKENSVERCRNSGDNNIMGIVSEKPSVVGNGGEDKENNPNYKIIGMLGQVAGKVTNENKEIKIGDSLTSSSLPGIMRKSNSGESTVGIALENFNEETGTIQVMISRKNKSLTVDKVEETVTQNIAEMNVQDQVDKMIAGAQENLNQQIAFQTGDLDKIKEYLNIISGNDLTNPITLDSLSSSINEQETAINEQGTKIADIQEQMDLIQEENKALMDFMLSVEAGRFVKTDEDGNVDLLDGKLEAGELVAGAFTVKIIDKERPTIGEAFFCQEGYYNDENEKKCREAVDEDNDGKDDESGKEIQSGMSVEIKTKAVSKSAKIFTSFENNDPGSSSWVEKVKDEENEEYTGFKILLSEPLLSDPVSEGAKVNWWIVESR